MEKACNTCKFYRLGKKPCRDCNSYYSNWKPKKKKHNIKKEIKKLKERIEKLENKECRCTISSLDNSIDNKTEEKKEIDFKLPQYLKSYDQWMFLVDNATRSNINGQELYLINEKKKIYATIKLQYIADKLNGEWKPDWNNADEDKWFIEYKSKKIFYEVNHIFILGHIYFKSEEIAIKAHEIMGDDIYLYLGVDKND